MAYQNYFTFFTLFFSFYVLISKSFAIQNTVVFDIRNDLPSNNLGGLAVGCNKSDYTCHINVGDHYNRTFQVGQSWECNAAWSRYFTFGWEVYQEKRDKGHPTIYWSVREDGFYHSLDASHWKLLAQWYSE